MKRKRLTVKYLKKIGACKEAVDWVRVQSSNDINVLYKQVLKSKEHLYWANWMLVRLMNKKQRIRYAIYAAIQVLYIYENYNSIGGF
jgi:hypothetical protein